MKLPTNIMTMVLSWHCPFSTTWFLFVSFSIELHRFGILVALEHLHSAYHRMFRFNKIHQLSSCRAIQDSVEEGKFQKRLIWFYIHLFLIDFISILDCISFLYKWCNSVEWSSRKTMVFCRSSSSIFSSLPIWYGSVRIGDRSLWAVSSGRGP